MGRISRSRFLLFVAAALAIEGFSLGCASDGDGSGGSASAATGAGAQAGVAGTSATGGANGSGGSTANGGSSAAGADAGTGGIAGDAAGGTNSAGFGGSAGANAGTAGASGAAGGGIGGTAQDCPGQAPALLDFSNLDPVECAEPGTTCSYAGGVGCTCARFGGCDVASPFWGCVAARDARCPAATPTSLGSCDLPTAVNCFYYASLSEDLWLWNCFQGEWGGISLGCT